MCIDQTRKYGISVSMIQALHYDIVVNKVIIRACIMDPEMPYFFINFSHYTSSAWCIMRYIVNPGLVSCPFYAIRIIIPYLIYEVLHLLVMLCSFLIINPRCACAARVTVYSCSVIPSICPSVRLSICYHVFYRYAQQDSQSATLVGSVPHWLYF